MSRLLALVEATAHPFILLRDWQNSPSSFTSTVLPSKFHFEVLAPDHSRTCAQQPCRNYGPHHRLGNPMETTCTPNTSPQPGGGNQGVYFPPMPATPDIDFRPWTSYQSQAFEIELYGNPPNASSQKWADWISCTEQYLLQEHPWAAQGRGATLQVVMKPLVTPKLTTTWRRGKPAVWEQLQVRFQLAVKQPSTMTAGPVRGFMRALQDAPQHWIGPPTWGQLLDTSHHSFRYRDPHAAELVQHTITHQLKETQQAANDENHLQYKEWLKQGIEGALQKSQKQ